MCVCVYVCMQPLGQRSISNTNHSDTGSARRATFQCVINAMNTS